MMARVFGVSCHFSPPSGILSIFIHLASLLLDSFDPVQGTMEDKGGGSKRGREHCHMTRIFYYIMIIRSVGSTTMYIQDASSPTLAVQNPKDYHAFRIKCKTWPFVCSHMMMVVVRTSGSGKFSRRGGRVLGDQPVYTIRSQRCGTMRARFQEKRRRRSTSV